VIFHRTEIDGVWMIDIDPIVDERGFFARAWCESEFAQHALPVHWPQSNIAWSEKRGTIRGLHFVVNQDEAKLVRCSRGAAYVVAADIRPNSPSYGRWLAVELTADNHRMLYVPPHCAQGYQTLCDGTEMLYQMSSSFVPDSTCGIRFDDPMFRFRWPLEVSSISTADQSWPLFGASSSATAPLSLATS
jgi:dTDP-4-dehydrorhamnose 3,5-epimerase